MVAVFAIFATLRLIEMKELGVSLAVAVLLDATHRARHRAPGGGRRCSASRVAGADARPRRRSRLA